MPLIFKSKLLREEIKHWIMTVALVLWGLTATVVALNRREKILLIGIDEAGTRIITGSSDRLLQSELKNFVAEFLNQYYSYTDQNFTQQMSVATDLMSEGLWIEKKAGLHELKQKLLKVPLEQKSEIQKLDLIEGNKVEASILLNVTSKMQEHKVPLKVIIEFQRKDRNDKNPWLYEITQINEQVL